MKKLARIVILVLAAAAMCGAALYWSEKYSNYATIPVPPIRLIPPLPPLWGTLSSNRSQQVVFQAWPYLPQYGVLVSLINQTKEDFRFNAKPLCDLSGLRALAEGKDGEQHELRIASSLGDSAISNPPSALMLVTLKPGEIFSWPIRILTDDQLQAEALHILYDLDRCVVTLDLEDESHFESNQFVLRYHPELRRKQGKCSAKEFESRLATFQWYLRSDLGGRYATVRDFIGMRRIGLLSQPQFDRCLDAALEDTSALVRFQAAKFPRTWSRLLVDGEADVRHEALRASAEEYSPQQMQLMPLLLLHLQQGDAPAKVLALRALARHTGGIIGRQYQDTIFRALNDPDPTVRQTVREHFSWLVGSKYYTNQTNSPMGSRDELSTRDRLRN